MAENGCLLCAPLVAESVQDMLAQMETAKSNGADLVELRVDCIKDFVPSTDLPKLINQRALPVLVTYRPSWEGGFYTGPDGPRMDALTLAVELGADYIDVELQVATNFISDIKNRRASSPTKIIVSNHNYQSTPSIEEVSTIIARIQETGADIIKIVTTAQHITDVSRVLPMLVHSQIPTIALVMGEKGLISRLLAPKYGGFLTFGSLASGKESAPGQPTLVQLIDLYKLRLLNRDAKVFGIIGNPVGHSKSPLLHNAAFAEIGFNAVYVPFLVDKLSDFLSVYAGPDFAGFSVTVPFKEEALKCCDEVDPVAKAIGAVNTIVKRQTDGKLIGYNTDCEAAISAIEDAFGEHNGQQSGGPLAGRLFVVVGAGGAGKALAFGAKQRGSRVVIANRNYERAIQLAQAVGAEAIPLEELNGFRPESGMILANTTTIGMHPHVHETPISKASLSSYSVVFDAVYTPRNTRLLQEATEMGAVVVSGLEMFIRQAIAQFQFFTGQPAPTQLMRDIISNSM